MCTIVSQHQVHPGNQGRPENQGGSRVHQDGVITQCVVRPRSDNRNSRSDQAPRDQGRRQQNWAPGFQDDYITNVALKINLKMGGNNSNLKLESIIPNRQIIAPLATTCIFGIDVSHGTTSDIGKPSIAAMVASVEANQWSRYVPEVRAQDARKECIEDCCHEMVVKLLNEFKRNHNGNPPTQIIVYRDGVSESQFEAVKERELPKFRTAWEEVVGENRQQHAVKITLIIVQKRHHTRFFARSAAGANFSNMAPGTVVSSGVCRTRDKDFYLCSHQSLFSPHHGDLVTSRPAHYTVLCDEIFNNDLQIIQILTNGLCYCFGRATKAVSIPAPVYYAHVAAKHYLNFGTEGTREQPQIGPLKPIMTERKHRMFYI